MPGTLKVLIVDDEQGVLDAYRDLVERLPSRPEVRTALSAARALALLDSEPFSLMLTDLRMPKMDGFQLLMAARRKFPALRTAVITGLTDEQYRARAYAIGIDLYLEKPRSSEETSIFADCIESLLDRVEQGGFRGVQSKSLMDLVQMECISQESSLLKISNGFAEGRIWIDKGDIIDAEVEELRGEEAFRRILGWRTGSFEIGAFEPGRERTIAVGGQSLLLDCAQWLDEVRAREARAAASHPTAGAGQLADLSRVSGVEFLVEVDTEAPVHAAWGAEHADQLAQAIRRGAQALEQLGDAMAGGTLLGLDCLGTPHHLAVRFDRHKILCIGLGQHMEAEQVTAASREVMKKWTT